MMNRIFLHTTDPAFNLAAEEYFFSAAKIPVFMLWQNDNAIVVGRNQNTFSEINAEEAEKQHVRVVRRITGGGAVYHDLGNINYSFIFPDGEGDYLNFKKFAAPVIEYLITLGVKAEFSGRNDMLIDGRKFSGNAQHASHGRILHHGTLLFSSDLDKIGTLLTVNPEKIKSKSVASVRSRITTIAEHLPFKMTVSEFINGLLDHVSSSGDVTEYTLTESDIASINALADSKYRTWEWNYGYSPKYSFRKESYISCGTVEVNLDIEEGIITRAKIYGDFFPLKPITEFEESLSGLRHSAEAITVFFATHEYGDWFPGSGIKELASCFI